MATISVAEALKSLTLSSNIEQMIKDNREIWSNFGKMNSHIYREMLMNLMNSSKLSGEARFMVFFFFSIIKNRERVLNAMNNLPATFKTSSWFPEVQKFIQTSIVQYVTASKANLKFPAVNIPSCNPGLDLLIFCMTTKKEHRNIDSLKDRTTFGQMALNDEMQDLAEKGNMNYWDNIVKGTKNSTATEAPKFRAEYYANIKGDQYKLLDPQLKEIMPESSAGYTREELIKWMDSFD